MRSRSILVACSLLALAAVAHATGPHDLPKHAKRPAVTPRVTVTTSADLAAAADARASSDANAAANATQRQVARSASGGNVLSTSSDVLALDLPGHEAATAVEGCQVSRGSLGFLGAGSGGRIKFDASCVAHVRCMETAAALERLGHADAAARVVVSCAGVELPADVLELVASPPAVSPTVPVYVTAEQLERAFRESTAK